MPVDDKQWFDELSGESSSNDPTINAVRELAAGYVAPVDDLALARLKRRLRKEQLLDRKSTVMFRRHSPKIAAVATVLLCFSVVMQSVLLPSSGYDDMQLFAESDGDLMPSAGRPEYSEQAPMGDDLLQNIDAPLEQRQEPKPAAAAPLADYEQGYQRELKQQQQERQRQLQQSATRSARELEAKQEEALRFYSEPAPQVEALPEPSAVAKTKPKATLIIELPKTTQWQRFDPFVTARDGGTLQVQCDTAMECDLLNAELGEQAGWSPTVKIAQPGVMYLLRQTQ